GFKLCSRRMAMSLLVTFFPAFLPLGLLSCNCTSSVPPVPKDEQQDLPFFNDVTANSGVEFSYRSGFEAGHFGIIESLGGGVGLIDYDRDGLYDLFITGGGYFGGKDNKEIKGYPCKLYKNLGNWKFKDITKEVGLERPWFYTHGVTVFDYDNDGWPDLLVTGW